MRSVETRGEVYPHRGAHRTHRPVCAKNYPVAEVRDQTNLGINLMPET